MRIVETPVNGIWKLKTDPLVDERGWFARLIDIDKISALALPFTIVQANASFNAHRDTLRGMHYQMAPDTETKLVSCRSGALFDVIVDIRPQSPTYTRWFGIELSAENYQSLYIPPGVAHGFLTLANNTEVYYQISGSYTPSRGQGLRWNDPVFAIDWPAEPAIMAERDRSYPDFQA